jgi:rhamnulokinase
MKKSQFLAFDLGAESGRAILGKLEEGRIILKEIHRFPTGMINIEDHNYWNIYRMYEEILTAISKCKLEFNVKPESIAIDTWGVDFSLLGPEGNILGLPYCYRDSRTDGIVEEFFKIMPRELLYQLTGIQILQFNTVFQLFAMMQRQSTLLNNASDLLFMPDLLNYLLSGVKSTEFSIATTSQLFNPRTEMWEREIFSAIGTNVEIMQNIVEPGTIIGNIHDKILQSLDMKGLPIISVASHDTGSAIAAIPAEDDEWAYISSGTWSLMGVECKAPIITDKTLAYNITNEGGVNKTYRVLKNIMGLWLLQQSRSVWGKDEFSYSGLVAMAASSKPFIAFMDPDNKSFLHPVNMPAAIMEYCRQSSQNIPGDIAAISRMILENLALKYRYTLDQLRTINSKPIEKIYIIGGGVQNELLCQFTANACGVPVITGPSEGTALGNIMVQAMAMGELSSLSQIRQIVKSSFPSIQFEPKEQEKWEEAYYGFKSHLIHTNPSESLI